MAEQSNAPLKRDHKFDFPSGPHEYHLVVAVFDAATSARISDATVTARISGLGLAGANALEPKSIAQTITYGGFFDLPGRDIYPLKLEIQRPGAKAVAANFTYDQR